MRRVMISCTFSCYVAVQIYFFLLSELNNSFKSTSPTAIQASPYLSAVISQLRQKGDVPIMFRAILCHRGLPVRRS